MLNPGKLLPFHAMTASIRMALEIVSQSLHAEELKLRIDVVEDGQTVG